MENSLFILRSLCLLFLGVPFLSCTSSTENTIQVFSSTYDFNTSLYDWSGDYADYRIKDSSRVKFQFEHVKIPENTGAERQSIFLSGDNLSESLFLFIKKKITGLTPNADYTIAFDVELISDINGISKDSIRLKAGATMIEPRKIQQDAFVRMNIDNGFPGSDGKDMIIIGTIDTGTGANNSQEYGLTQSGIASTKYLYVTSRTNANGDIWLILGIDSQHAGITSVYLTKAVITFSVSN